MKVLIDNLIDSATLTSLYGSLNYPVTNLQLNSLAKRFQSSADVDTVIMSWPSTHTISDFWYGNTNATEITVNLYSGSDLLYTFTNTSPDPDIDAFHFTPVAGIDSVEVMLTGAAIGVYIGGIGIGVATVFPNPLAAWEEPMRDNTIITENKTGQIHRDYVRPLRVYKWTFPEITYLDKEAFVEMFADIGTGLPLWLDPFEGNHSFCKPLYAYFTAAFNAVKSGRRYSFSISLMEAR